MAETVKKEVVAEEAKAPKAKKAAAPKAEKSPSEAKPAAKKAAAPKAAATEKAPAKKAAAPKAEKPVEEKEVVAEAAPKAPKAKKAAAPVKPSNRLKQKYVEQIVPQLMKEFNYKSVMQVPHLEKVVINVGVGEATANSKVLEDVIKEITAITGQKPVATLSKKAIASFKLREGVAIGCKVTLRGKKMYEFLDKLFAISLPRVRDFRGVNKNAFDGRGNYTLGVKEQLIFPEIKYENVTKIRGMDIVIVTTANTDKEAFALLSNLGMPFAK